MRNGVGNVSVGDAASAANSVETQFLVERRVSQRAKLEVVVGQDGFVGQNGRPKKLLVQPKIACAAE